VQRGYALDGTFLTTVRGLSHLPGVKDVAKLIPKECLVQFIISLTLDIARSIER
jgi:hypothetical protein